MKHDNIYCYLLEQRKNNNDFFTARDIANAVGISNNGNLFRRMNKLAVIYEVLDVKIDSSRLCRTYRLKEEELLENEKE